MSSALRRVALPFAVLSLFASSSAVGQANAVTAFVDVNVVPMDTERVLPHQTVLVVDGKIANMGPHIDVPPNARTLDGHGTAYLAPGLADMHTHAHTQRDMAVFLANGVTTILDMGNAPSDFIAQVRPAVEKGNVPGPRIYAGFLLDGSPRYGNFVVTTPEDARAAVRIAKANGYEFIKVYTELSPACFDAIVDEARRQQMPVVGHGVRSVGLEKQMAAGQLLVAHMEEFFYTVFSQPPADQPNRAPSVEEIPHVIETIRKTGAYVTADLNTYATIARQWGRPEVVTGFLKTPESRYVSPGDRLSWRFDGYEKRTGSLDGRVAFLARFTKALADAGIPLVAGTDAPAIPGLVSGFALHDDLQALYGAGLTPYQVLITATRTPGRMVAEHVPGVVPFGVVAVGNRADLVLVRANPLGGLATLREPIGVMANGRWYDGAELARLREQVLSDYARAAWSGDEGKKSPRDFP